MPRIAVVLVVAMFLISATGCGTSFHIKDIAKSDIDFVADTHYEQAEALLVELCAKLYRRNPVQLRRAQLSGGIPVSADSRTRQLFEVSGPLVFGELGQRRGTEAMELALQADFNGDRVFALMAGLTGMIRHSYDYRDEFFMFDELDQQKLYRSARNVEILLWRLSQAQGEGGEPLILTNHRSGEPENLSFERLFGKLIATQDLLAEIAAQKNNRLINQVAHNAASFVFFPL